MKQTIETLKTYFETGDIPTEAQYVDLIDSLAMPMIGEIKTVSFATVPNGWAKCDGQILTIAEHQTLFNLIGTTYGGNGTTTFALPNLQGKTMIHNDATYGLGNVGGSVENTLSESQMPAHKHDVGTMTASHNLTGTVKALADEGLSDEAEGNNFCSNIPNSYTISNTDALMAADNVQINGIVSLSGSTTTSGSATPVNNMQPYLAVNTIIALEGIDPLAN
jgi:microcystin-dependent protein